MSRVTRLFGGPHRQRSAAPHVVWSGDSFIDFDYGRAHGYDQSQSWVSQTMALLQAESSSWTFDNNGVGGRTTSTMLDPANEAITAALVRAGRTNLGFFFELTNDLAYGAAPAATNPEQVWTNGKTWMLWAAANVGPGVTCTIPPRSDQSIENGRPYLNQMQRLYWPLYSYALVDIAAMSQFALSGAQTNPANFFVPDPIGAPATTDGVHPGVGNGIALLAAAAKAALKAVWAYVLAGTAPTLLSGGTFTDAMTGADGTDLLNHAPTGRGNAWCPPLLGQWTLQSNKCQSAAANTSLLTYVGAGATDISVVMNWQGHSNDCGLWVRALNGRNGFLVDLYPATNSVYLFEVDNGSFTTRVSATTSPVALSNTGDFTIRVVDDGTSIKLYVNGVLAYTYSTTAKTANACVGFSVGGSSGSSGQTWDNFSCAM